jgi:hypothetical protein
VTRPIPARPTLPSPASLAESRALHDRARAMIRAFERGAPMPEPFDSLAVNLARFQAAHVAGYARLCASRGVDPQAITRAGQAPAVPTDAFRFARVFAFDDAVATATFRTSGTTVGARGAHPLRDVATYDAGALAFARTVLSRGAESATVLVLGPSATEAPDSSLAHMCTLFAESLVAAPPFPPPFPSDAPSFFVEDGRLRVAAFEQRVASHARRSGSARDAPIILLATSFALVHWLDAVGDAVVALPPGSRIMQTGGFKGRSREVSAPELRRAVARAFAVDERAVIAEYGMTELSSQFWEATLVDESMPHGVFVEPPWARVIPVDGETLAPVPYGEVGIARIEDLANVDSAFAILAQDRVRRVPGGFELLGRAPLAAARGCSIALDEILSASVPDRGAG